MVLDKYIWDEKSLARKYFSWFFLGFLGFFSLGFFLGFFGFLVFYFGFILVWFFILQKNNFQ